jgi:uncharacterized membrane protein YfcA
VPFLVAAGSLALLTQPALTAAGARRGLSVAGPPRGGDPLALVTVALVSVYSGYFGAGSGVLLLVAAMALLDPGLPRANAMKNMLVGASAVASAVVFILAGPVDWAAVAPLALGLFAGSLLGPVLARRLPPGLVRGVVGALGLVLAVKLWLGPS